MDISQLLYSTETGRSVSVLTDHRGWCGCATDLHFVYTKAKRPFEPSYIYEFTLTDTRGEVL